MKRPIKVITIFTFLILGFFLFKNQQQRIDFPKQFTSIVTAIDVEIQQLEALENTSRVLTDSLIMAIAELANSLKPVEMIDQSSGIKRKLSPERGNLLSTLVSKKLNSSTYQKIFEAATFEHAFLEEADLSNAPLDKILLNQSYFKNVNLANASLVNANLCKAHFKNVNLRSTNLNIANLREANLDGSNLTKANFKSAYLIDAELAGVQTQETSFIGANLAGVNFSDTAKNYGNNN